jgi:uncharacterized protein involved in outer membrane biogenesis
VTGVAVKVSDVKISLKDGRGTLKGLTVANPKGFSTPLAIALGEVTLGIDIGSVTKNPVVITDVLVAAPEITYELNNQGGSNIDALQKNLQASSGGGGSGKVAPPPSESEKDTKKLVIDRLVVNNGKVTLATPIPGGKASATLGEIKLTNIGRASGGATGAEVATQLLQAISSSAIKGVSSLGIGSLIDGATTGAGGLGKGGLDQVKGLLGK